MHPSKRYRDSNVFLAFLQKEPETQKACRDTIEAAQHGDFLIVTSALTIAEVLWLKGSPRLTEDRADTLNKFFRRSSIRIVNLDRNIAQKAQRLVWENSVRPKDAVHVATAQRYNCPLLETFDRELIKKGLDIEGIEIGEPQPAVEGPLFRNK